MNNQEPQNQDKTTEDTGVEKRRRFIAGASVAAPVILTLSSPSAFGALCLSQMMSGNVSSVGEGSCTLGQTPAWWSSPINKSAWATAGFDYGQKNPSTAPELCSNYKNGTKFKAAFGVNPTSGDQNTFMLNIICNSTTNTTLDAYLVAALLNASLPNSGYLLIPTDVIGMKTGKFTLPPGYTDLLIFLKSTMA